MLERLHGSTAPIDAEPALRRGAVQEHFQIILAPLHRRLIPRLPAKGHHRQHALVAQGKQVRAKLAHRGRHNNIARTDRTFVSGEPKHPHARIEPHTVAEVCK